MVLLRHAHVFTGAGEEDFGFFVGHWYSFKLFIRQLDGTNSTNVIAGKDGAEGAMTCAENDKPLVFGCAW